MNFIDGKGQKSKLRSSRNILTNHIKSNHATSYLQGWTHTHTHTNTHTWRHESDFKKPGACKQAKLAKARATDHKMSNALG